MATQPGHPSMGKHNEYWRWSRSPLGKKWRVLCNSGPVPGLLAYWHSWLKVLVAMGPAIRLTCVVLVCQLNWVYPCRLKGLRLGMSSRAVDLVQAHIFLLTTQILGSAVAQCSQWVFDQLCIFSLCKFIVYCYILYLL